MSVTLLTHFCFRYIVRDNPTSKDRSAFENILYSIEETNSLSKPFSKTLGYEIRPSNSPRIENRVPEPDYSYSSADDLVVSVPTKRSPESDTDRFSDEKANFTRPPY